MEIERRNKISNFTIYLLLGVVVSLFYFKTLNFLFLGDDWDIVLKREHLFSKWDNVREIFFIPSSGKELKKDLYRYYNLTAEASYRPLNTFSYFIDYKIWKLNPSGFHLTNVLLHMLNGCLAYRLFYILVSSQILAFLGAVFFLIHPLVVEPVAVVSFREDLLALLFSLIALNLYLNLLSKKSPAIYLIFSYIFYLLALLSKESVVPLCLIFVYMYLLQRKAEDERNYKRGIRLFLLFSLVTAFVFTCLRIFFTPEGGRNYKILQAGLTKEILTSVTVMGDYLKHLILPLHLKFYLIEQFPLVEKMNINFVLNASLVMLFLIVALKIILNKQSPYALRIGVFWLFVFLMPLCLIRFLPSVAASRYLYLPLVGLGLIVAEVIKEIREKYRRGYLISVLSLLFLGTVYIHRDAEEIGRWRNDIAFWERMKRDFPDNPRIYYNYGNYLFSFHLLLPALREYLTAYTFRPEDQLILEKIAITLFCLRKYGKAEMFYNKILKKYPDSIVAYNGLGIIAAIRSQKEKAKELFQKALKIDPLNKTVARNLKQVVRGDKQGFELYFER